MNVCTSCKAPILWVKTITGKSMPLDAEPLAERPKKMLGVFVLNDEGLAVGATMDVAREVAQGGNLYVSHFSTCPYADEHRR